MHISNEIYYHIKRDGTPTEDWYIGNRFNWRNRQNNFSRSLKNLDFTIPFSGKPMTYIEAHKNFESYTDISNDERLMHLQNFHSYSEWALLKSSTMIRELVLEEYRKTYLSFLPSRFNCVWFCKELALNNWIRLTGANKANYKIFEVRLNGEGHISNNTNLAINVMNITQHEYMAQRYWDLYQQHGGDSELIFNGEIEVLRQL